MVERVDLVRELLEILAANREKKAIITEGEEITYSELYDNALKYASFFKKEMQGNNIVCVICKRSMKLYEAVLGIVLAGGSYLLYEPDDMNEMVIQVIKSINPCLIIADEEFSAFDTALSFGEIENSKEKCKITSRKPETRLYLVNTSGTTGKSKTVCTSDENLMCYLNGYIKCIGVNGTDVMLQQSPIYYDGFAEEFFAMLLVGGTVVFTDKVNLKSPHKIIEIINQYKVTILPSTPMMIEKMNQLRKNVGLRAVISSGDVLKKAQIDWLLKRCDVYNMYGLTETTICATCHQCSENDDVYISMGKPIEGYEIVLLDEDGNFVPVGEQGEVYIQGKGVSSGYLSEEDNIGKISYIQSKRSFKTGDYAWKDKNGEYHYVGRSDRQVKIRGNRVSLEQIESILVAYEEIKTAVAIYNDSTNLLIVFFVSDIFDTKMLQKRCKESMASYMLPNRYVQVSDIPMTKTGKVDYRKLEEMSYDDDNEIDNTNEDECDEIEQKIIDIISTINCGQVKLCNTWEELGVDSISYVMILVEMEEYFSIELDDEVLIQDTTTNIKSFCKEIKKMMEMG